MSRIEAERFVSVPFRRDQLPGLVMVYSICREGQERGLGERKTKVDRALYA